MFSRRTRFVALLVVAAALSGASAALAISALDPPPQSVGQQAPLTP